MLNTINPISFKGVIIKDTGKTLISGKVDAQFYQTLDTCIKDIVEIPKQKVLTGLKKTPDVKQGEDKFNLYEFQLKAPGKRSKAYNFEIKAYDNNVRVTVKYKDTDNEDATYEFCVQHFGIISSLEKLIPKPVKERFDSLIEDLTRSKADEGF